MTGWKKTALLPLITISSNLHHFLQAGSSLILPLFIFLLSFFHLPATEAYFHPYFHDFILLSRYFFLVVFNSSYVFKV